MFRWIPARRAYLGLLAAMFVMLGAPRSGRSDDSTAAMRQAPSVSEMLSRSAAEFLRDEVVALLVSFGVSLLTGWVTARFVAGGRAGKSRIALAIALSLLLSVTFTVLLTGGLSAGTPAPGDLVVPALGCLAGIAGHFLVHSPGRRIRRALAGSVLVVFGLAVGLIGLLLTVSEAMPAGFEPAVPTAQEKQALMTRLRGTQLLDSDPSKPREIHLDAADANLLLVGKLALDRVRIQSRVFLEDEHFLLLASRPWKPPGLPGRFLNAQMTGRIDVRSGTLEIQIDELRLGKLHATPRMCARLERALAQSFKETAEVQPVLASLESVRIHGGNIEITTRPNSDPAKAGATFLNGARLSPELKRATIEQVEHLAGKLTPYGRPPLEEILKESFQLAHEQSADLDPLEANRASLLALGILFADANLGRLVDYRVSPETQKERTRRAKRARVRGRTDWVQHFCGSAALAATAGNVLGNLAGVMKEEIDSGVPGKGFSFGDVLANRAGIRFADACLHSPAAARSMQDRLRLGVTVNELFPAADGLPENIPEEELRAKYGGIGGVQYQKWIEEIEQRLDRTPLLQSK